MRPVVTAGALGQSLGLGAMQDFQQGLVNQTMMKRTPDNTIWTTGTASPYVGSTCYTASSL